MTHFCTGSAPQASHPGASLACIRRAGVVVIALSLAFLLLFFTAPLAWGYVDADDVVREKTAVDRGMPA